MIKINKPMARKMYYAGYTIKLLPCKVCFPNMWIEPVEISKNENDEENSFDRKVNEYEYYSCNKETGYYAHYFISKKDIKAK